MLGILTMEVKTFLLAPCMELGCVRSPSRDVGWCTPLCLDICILSFNSLQACGNSFTDDVLDFPEPI
jgi:hypothetical protein